MDRPLYPVLAGTYRPRPLWLADGDAERAPQAIKDVLEGLARLDVIPEDLGEIHIPLLHEGLGPAPRSWEAYWIDASMISVDRLISIQAHNRADSVVTDMRISQQSADMPFLLSALPSLSHCAAFWIALAGKAFSPRGGGNIDSSPVHRDEDCFDRALNGLREWYDPHFEGLGHSLRYREPRLFRTPPTPRLAAQMILTRISSSLSSCALHTAYSASGRL
jgi:hypothetical protein